MVFKLFEVAMNITLERSNPNSKKLSYRTVSLPMNEKLSFLELEYIVDKVNEFN